VAKKEEDYRPHANISNEHKLISFLMRNPTEVFGISEAYFVDPISQGIYAGIKSLQEQGLHFDLDTLRTVLVESQCDIPMTQLQGVHDRFTDFTNMDFVKTTARNNGLKFKLYDSIRFDFLSRVKQADFLRPEDVQSLIDRMQHEVDLVTGRDQQLLTWGELTAEHKHVLEARDAGKLQRSLGFKALDQMLARPAAEEEFTVYAAPKGQSKSIMAKSIEFNLLRRKVCVLSLNLEMSKRSTMDRVICMHSGVSLQSLQQKNLDPEIKAAAHKVLNTDFPNYLYCPSETMTLRDVDAVIRAAQLKFRQAGVLPDDDYMFVTVDSLDMIEGFNDAREIKANIDQFHRIVRKNHIHAFCLLQLNENKLRDTRVKFTEPQDVDKLRFTDADIFGGSYYSARARAVFIGNRPLVWKQKFFPELAERWATEETFNDILYVSLQKANDRGSVMGYCKFNFEGAKLRITAPRDGAVAL